MDIDIYMSKQRLELFTEKQEKINFFKIFQNRIKNRLERKLFLNLFYNIF